MSTYTLRYHEGFQPMYLSASMCKIYFCIYVGKRKSYDPYQLSPAVWNGTSHLRLPSLCEQNLRVPPNPLHATCTNMQMFIRDKEMEDRQLQITSALYTDTISFHLCYRHGKYKTHNAHRVMVCGWKSPQRINVMWEWTKLDKWHSF